MLAGPGVVAAPENTPAEDKLIPEGAPATVHVYGGTPPVAPSAVVNGVPTSGFGRLPVVIVKGAGAIVKVNARLAVVPAESVTVAFTVKVPACVGVPLKVAPAAERPSGAPLMDHVSGNTPPVAASVTE